MKTKKSNIKKGIAGEKPVDDIETSQLALEAVGARERDTNPRNPSLIYIYINYTYTSTIENVIAV